MDLTELRSIATYAYLYIYIQNILNNIAALFDVLNYYKFIIFLLKGVNKKKENNILK